MLELFEAIEWRGLPLDAADTADAAAAAAAAAAADISWAKLNGPCCCCCCWRPRLLLLGVIGVSPPSGVL